MKTALWIIAICEVVRAAQNALQIGMYIRDASARDNCYAEFVKSLESSDREFVERLLKEFEENDNDRLN